MSQVAKEAFRTYQTAQRKYAQAADRLRVAEADLKRAKQALIDVVADGIAQAEDITK